MTHPASSPLIAGPSVGNAPPPPPPGSDISRRRAWLLAARPRTLPAAISPVIVGTAVAVHEHGFRLLAALACVAVALLIQIAANFANDAFDFHRGADTPERIGPLRVTAAGLIPPREVLRAMWLTIGLAMLAGAYLVWLGGPAILLAGLLAIAATIAYTGGPLPYGYAGLGDLFVFLFFGLVAVNGTAFVQTGHLTGLSLAASVPMGCLAMAILVVNNLRDREGDARAGKRTLAVRFGRRAAIAEYIVLMGITFAVPLVLLAAGSLHLQALLPLLLLPIAVSMVRGLLTETGPLLNVRLAGTARLELLFAIVFAVALVR